VENKTQGTEERTYNPHEEEVLKKVGTHFTREELATLERLLNDKSTKLAAGTGSGSAAYHR
jgi:hypothetical protein